MTHSHAPGLCQHCEAAGLTLDDWQRAYLLAIYGESMRPKASR